MADFVTTMLDTHGNSRHFIDLTSLWP